MRGILYGLPRVMPMGARAQRGLKSMNAGWRSVLRKGASSHRLGVKADRPRRLDLTDDSRDRPIAPSQERPLLMRPYEGPYSIGAKGRRALPVSKRLPETERGRQGNTPRESSPRCARRCACDNQSPVAVDAVCGPTSYGTRSFSYDVPGLI
jgi:hypothetical protein